MKIRLSALFVIALIIGLTACKKKNDDAPTITSKVGLNVINTSADTINIYLNGSRLNTTSVILPGYSTGYYLVPEGKQTYEIKKPFNVNSNLIQNLFSLTLPLDTNYYRTLFITDGKAEDAFTTNDVFYRDTTAAADTTCFIRLVNSLPGSGSLVMTYGNDTISTGIPFKGYTGFTEVSTTRDASATGVVPLKIFNTGSATILYKDSVSLSAASSYTVYTMGIPGGTGFTVGIRRN